MLPALICCFAITNPSAQDFSNEQILAMGHRTYVTRFPDPDSRAAAERRFALAQGERNELAIKASPRRKKLEELQNWVANLTKCSMRIADYVPENEQLRFLLSRKCEAAANLAIAAFISESSPTRKVSQAGLWKTFRRGQAFHAGNKERIEKFGGYSFQQLQLEFGSVGRFSDDLLKAVANQPLGVRLQAISYCDTMMRVTMGEDPFGY